MYEVKAFILKEEDFERLLLVLENFNLNKFKDNQNSPEKIQLIEDVYRLYNYHIQTWIQEVKK